MILLLHWKCHFALTVPIMPLQSCTCTLKNPLKKKMIKPLYLDSFITLIRIRFCTHQLFFQTRLLNDRSVLTFIVTYWSLVMIEHRLKVLTCIVPLNCMASIMRFCSVVRCRSGVFFSSVRFMSSWRDQNDNCWLTFCIRDGTHGSSLLRQMAGPVHQHTFLTRWRHLFTPDLPIEKQDDKDPGFLTRHITLSAAFIIITKWGRAKSNTGPGEKILVVGVSPDSDQYSTVPDIWEMAAQVKPVICVQTVAPTPG